MRREISGAWKARACVVLLGTSVPSSLLSRISWSKWVVKTDSAILRVGMRPQYFPWLRVLAV